MLIIISLIHRFDALREVSPYNEPIATPHTIDALYSDFLKIELKNATYVPSITGLYSKSFIRGYADNTLSVICEFRGDLIPFDDAYFPFPMVVNSITKQNYIIEGDSPCHHVNDCIDLSSENFEMFPGCSYNAVFDMSVTGKFYLYSKRDIAPGEEIFVNYGIRYWELKRAMFGLDAYKNLVVNRPLPVGVIDSEYLSVFEADSILPVPNVSFCFHLWITLIDSSIL